MFSEWSVQYPHLDPGAPRENALLLRFRDGAVRNERLSADGPSVYDRVFQVQVMAIGQKQSSPIYTLMKIVGGKEKIEEPREYQQFKQAFDAWRANIEPSHEGTPLEHWPLMTRDLVRAFKDANIPTVEMLATAGDNAANAVRAPFFEWRIKAQAWLKDAREKGGDAKARVELAKAEERIKTLETQVQQLLAIQNGATPQPAGFKKGRKKANGASDELHIAIPDEAAAEFDEDRI
jgi:hypothetical protein